MLSKYPAKVGVHRSCGNEKIPFFICRVTAWSMCHVTLWVGSLHLKSAPANFGVHRPCESEDITFYICHMAAWLMCNVALRVGFPHPR